MVRGRSLRCVLPDCAAALTTSGPATPGAAAKAALRERIRADRSVEPLARGAARGVRLATFSTALSERSESGLAGFQPTNREPDVLALLRAVHIPVFLPRVTGVTLEWVRAQPDDLAARERRGIPRPTGPAIARGAEIARLVDVLLVPALAIDPTTGARLGYGSGFYDRLIADLPASVLTVGVCRDKDLQPVPVEVHDRAVAAVLTESGLRPVGAATVDSP